ncbi:MAG: sodium:proton antiporter NhaD [Prevotellaceae bacterium]|jgi:Na+/H+ antiporter NhaD/arsenite permease-like protein|nr:sodium:proton antiporter NhaD [Prevotellaceae bacterium]
MELFLVLLFLTGYVGIALEHVFKTNKAGTALCMGTLCWTVFIVCSNSGDVNRILEHLNEELSGIANILFLLIGAMTVVEVIDSHDGFCFITESIRTKSKRKLLWIISLVTFFLSAALDNLTTTIIMASLLGKLISNRRDKLMFVSMLVIAANAGGAWSPMGDVTTTMLWIGGQISTAGIITKVFLPSLVSMAVPLIAFSFFIKGKIVYSSENVKNNHRKIMLPKKVRNIIFFMGISILLFVPVFKALTHLPPYVGMLLGVGILWIYTGGILYRKHRGGRLKEHLSVTSALRKIETSTILFFLGILLCVGALHHSGILSYMAEWLNRTIGNQNMIVTIIGAISSIVDNVPLVAAAQGMYGFPTDHFFWEFLAYAAGTGGSMLIIGSAAGVAVMGQEKINFVWYVKNISLWALLGYLAGALTCIVQEKIINPM